MYYYILYIDSDTGIKVTSDRPVQELLDNNYKEVTDAEFNRVKIFEPTPDPEPTQLDLIEAQVTYTAMMTNTLLEV